MRMVGSSFPHYPEKEKSVLGKKEYLTGPSSGEEKKSRTPPIGKRRGEALPLPSQNRGHDRFGKKGYDIHKKGRGPLLFEPGGVNTVLRRVGDCFNVRRGDGALLEGKHRSQLSYWPSNTEAPVTQRERRRCSQLFVGKVGRGMTFVRGKGVG